LSDYVGSGELSGEQGSLLAAAADRGASILVGGETCSGKTTLLNALLQEAGKHTDRRLLVIEDTPELEVPAGPSQRLEVPPNGSFTFAHAIKSALRMRPNAIVLGEVRDGDAAYYALRACRTGHQGLSTIHAGSCQGMLWELYSLCRQSEQGRHILERTVSDSVSVCVHLTRKNGRRVIDVQRVHGWNAAAGEYLLEQVR
jgi:type IV secretion system protein VirB11